jgi:hypothetical protein
MPSSGMSVALAWLQSPVCWDLCPVKHMHRLILGIPKHGMQ